MRGTERSQGYTLIEVIFACTILAIAFLGFGAAITAGRNLSIISRERSSAMNSMRTYIETMRARFPTSTTTTDMTDFLNDTSVPILDTKILVKGATSQVYKCNDETGTNWVQVLGGGSAGMVGTDRIALGFTTNPAGSGGTLDLAADGPTASTNVAGSKLVRCPVKVVIQWYSATGGANRQQLVSYVYFGGAR